MFKAPASIKLNLLYFFVILFIALTRVDAQMLPKSPEGIWQGTLSIQSVELRLVAKITAQKDGSYKATLDSPDQGVKDIPVDLVTATGTTLKLDLSSIKGSYEGTYDSDSTLSGTWKQGGMSLPLALKRVKEVLEVKRPQEPVRPFPYIEEEVVFENASAGIKLAGTLTRPHADKPVPAVLMITGSGPQDRDEALMNHKPFFVIADYLTRRGIAVLRVDDRGMGKSTGNFGTATTEDFATDAVAGVRYLKTRKEISPANIGLIGHSEGGIVAPMAANLSKDVAFIVLMAGTGLTGEEILYRQTALILKANGASDGLLDSSETASRKLYAILKHEKDSAAAATKIRGVLEESAAAQRENNPQDTTGTEARISQQVITLMSPWFRFFLTYDPVPALKKVRCPVLAINGEKDLQVPAKENLEAIEKALKAGGNTKVTIKLLPGLNHLFQKAETGSPAEYAKIEETISYDALKIMGDWIEKQSSK